MGRDLPALFFFFEAMDAVVTLSHVSPYFLLHLGAPLQYALILDNEGVSKGGEATAEIADPL